MTEIVLKTELGRQAHYTVVCETGNPTRETLMAVLGAFGLELKVQKKPPVARMHLLGTKNG